MASISTKADKHVGGDQKENDLLTSIKDKHYNLIDERGDHDTSKRNAQNVTKELIAKESGRGMTRSDSQSATQSSCTLSIVSTDDNRDDDNKVKSTESSDSEMILIDEDSNIQNKGSNIGNTVSELREYDPTIDERLPETVTLLTTPDGGKLYLVGTAHFSVESQNDVSKIIQAVQPHIVAVELCRARVGILQLDEEVLFGYAKNIDYKTIMDTIKREGLYDGLLHILLLRMAAHVAKELGMPPGGEFRRAFEEVMYLLLENTHYLYYKIYMNSLLCNGLIYLRKVPFLIKKKQFFLFISCCLYFKESLGLFWIFLLIYNYANASADEYEHIVADVMYIINNIPGPGIDIADFEAEYAVGCSCVAECFNCSCTRGSANYSNARIVDEKLIGPVFECHAHCKCRPDCGNRLVQNGPLNCLIVREVANKGLGLFTNKLIKKGQFICEYAGEVISLQEARCRIEANKQGNMMNYVLVVSEHAGDRVIVTCIDPKYFGNIGRYANHSCDPNSILIPIRVEGIVPRLCLFASKDIENREEVTFDYAGGAMVNSVHYLSDTSCLCGSGNCHRYLPHNQI
ncbi:Histone-lysine N-methyltransferase SETMAR [Trachymyrmex cornetzi]|uniref:Histone-lysine N-methyltransferase SETMAR n=1 Tax=Trachymyrmex cornetzi TaxID=471704 RepID=A0A151JA03_9HYME|nr:Histone-lysine N-methyltransferase SETMAR [Trachymyrmex cornetzi]